EARHRFRRRRPHPRRQRLSAPDRQHPLDARCHREAAGHRRGARSDPLEKRRRSVEAEDGGAEDGGVAMKGWPLVLALVFMASGPARTETQAEMTRVPQFENARAVSWKSIIPPHTSSTLHRHDRFRTVIAIAGGDLTLVDPDGRKT